MTLREYVRTHRAELDARIQSASPGTPQNDYERELWVMNDEALYAQYQEAKACRP